MTDHSPELTADKLADLDRRARGAYERGRLRVAIVWSLPGVAVAGAALLLGRPLLEVVALGSLSTAAAIWALHRGQGFQDGVAPGLLIGSVPLVGAFVWLRAAGTCSTQLCNGLCFGVTALLATALGAVLADRAANRGPQWLRVVFAAALVAAPLALLGCRAMTFGGSVGLVLGLLAGTVPMGVRAAAR